MHTHQLGHRPRRRARNKVLDQTITLPAAKGTLPLVDPATLAQACRLARTAPNESPHPPSPKAVEAVRNYAGDLNRYPDIHAHALTEAISARTGVPADQIISGAGTDELVCFICEITTGPGDVAFMPWPTFPRYAATTLIEGGESIKVPLDGQGANDADALLAAINNRTPTVWCCTPNPPSGGIMDEKALRQLAGGVPENVLLAVDEAYHENGRHEGPPGSLAGAAHLLQSLRPRR